MQMAKSQHQQAPKGALILGGAHGSLAIARSLGRRGIPVRLVTDDNPLATLSRYVQRSFSWPSSSDKTGGAFLLDLAKTYDLEGWMLFAGSDDDVRFIAQNHAQLATAFTLTTPAWDVARWAYDKARMNLRATELGIARPLSFYPRGRDDLANIGIPFPVILKPTVRAGRNAFVDAKAWRADDMAALAGHYEAAITLVSSDSIMIQELIPGDGATQFSYAGVWQAGTPIGSLVAKRRRQYPVEFGFTSTLVETIESTEIEEAASRFLRSLDYSGLVEIEFKYDRRDSSYKILDINARAWTWMALGAAAGVDFPAIQWRLACGEKIAPVTAQRGRSWLYLSRDLVASAQEILTGRLSVLDYFRMLRWPSSAAVFAWDDPWPAVLDLPLVATRVVGRRLARRDQAATASATLQSARLPY